MTTKTKPEFKELKFKTENSFTEWLEAKTAYKIHLEDRGQDFLTWYIDKRGEVLHSDGQSWLWNGTIVKTFSVGKQPKLILPDGTNTKLNYSVTKIEETKIK